MRQRADRFVSYNTCVIHNFLKLTSGLSTLLRRQVRFASQINRIESEGESRIRLSHFIRRSRRERVDGLFAVTAVNRDCSPDHWEKVELYDGVFAETFAQIGGQSPGLYGIARQSKRNGRVPFRLSAGG